jgi:hypothetical protein
MQIKIETTETDAGPMHDLVLVQGNNTIRLGLTCLVPALAAAQLGAWINENTLDVAAIVCGKDDEDAKPIQGTVRVRQYGGTYMASVRVGNSCTYKASCTAGSDQAASALAAKVQAARCATRVTLSVRTPGADTGPAFAGEDHYLLSVFEA